MAMQEAAGTCFSKDDFESKREDKSQSTDENKRPSRKSPGSEESLSLDRACDNRGGPVPSLRLLRSRFFHQSLSLSLSLSDFRLFHDFTFYILHYIVLHYIILCYIISYHMILWTCSPLPLELCGMPFSRSPFKPGPWTVLRSATAWNAGKGTAGERPFSPSCIVGIGKVASIGAGELTN